MAANTLFNLADKEYQFWKSFTYDGVDWDFSHLSVRKHTFQHPSRNERYTVYFTISHHVFTTEIEQTPNVTDDQIYPYKTSDLRAFCKNRYQLSLHLPEILENLSTKFCYHGGFSRYCSCKLKDEKGNDILYQVVYRVWKERGKMRFHIESAYPLPEPLGKVKKVNFWVICHNLLKGKRMPKPAQ
jgi:hypothetical protein